jgi:hypothetical protein
MPGSADRFRASGRSSNDYFFRLRVSGALAERAPDRLPKKHSEKRLLAVGRPLAGAALAATARPRFRTATLRSRFRTVTAALPFPDSHGFAPRAQHVLTARRTTAIDSLPDDVPDRLLVDQTLDVLRDDVHL